MTTDGTGRSGESRPANALREMRAVAALALPLAGLFLGCASSVEPYPTRSPEALSAHEERSGLTVAAAPLVKRKESKRYFGADLTDAEIVPILIVVRNASPDASYLLLEDRVSIAIPSGAAARADHAPTSNQRAMGTQVAGLVLLGASGAFPPLVLVGLPVYLVGATMEPDNREVQGRLVANALRSTTLSPGAQTQGFVYFARKDFPKGSQACVVTIELARMDGGAAERFELPISLEEFP